MFDYDVTVTEVQFESVPLSQKLAHMFGRPRPKINWWCYGGGAPLVVRIRRVTVTELQFESVPVRPKACSNVGRPRPKSVGGALVVVHPWS